MAESLNLRDEVIGRDQSALEIRHELSARHADGFDAFSVAVHAQDGAHVLLAHQRLERPHTAADIEADEHSAEVKDVDGLMGIIRVFYGRIRQIIPVAYNQDPLFALL